MNFVYSVSRLITRFHPASCFCGSFLYVFITPLFLVFFLYIYIPVSFFIFSFPSLVSFVILHSFRSSICLYLYLSVLVYLFLSSLSFLLHTNPYIFIYFSSIFSGNSNISLSSLFLVPVVYLHISDFYFQ